MDARLYIYDPTNSNAATHVGVLAEIPISINLAISDVRNPDQRNSSFSKTISLPGTQQINKIFEHIFDVNTVLGSFNPNLKTRVKYYVKMDKVFDGDLQLLKIRKVGKSPEISITYEVSIVGRLANVFIDMGNSLLEDLDFSDLNHVFGYAQRNWTPTLGTGYTYPLIDYGVNGGNTAIWDFAHLKAAIFEKEYISRMFTALGKTYTSTYLSSTYGKSIVIPNTRAGAYKMTNAQVNAISFYAGKTADTTNTITLNYSNYNPALGYSSNGWWSQNVQPFGLALGGSFNDDSTAPYYDGGGNFSTVTSIYQAPSQLELKFSCKCDFEVRINAPAGTNGYTIVNTFGYAIDVAIFEQFVGYIGSATIQVYPNYTTWTAVSCSVVCNYILSPALQNYYVVIQGNDATYNATQFFNFGIPIVAGTASIDVKLKSTSWFSGTSATGNLPIGYTVDMNQCVPKNIKQIDFLTSWLKSENLYMELDLTDTNNYIIEKRDDFYLTNSSALDWTSKWDYQKEIEILPMGELDAREYLFTYKTDGDKFNKLYKDAFGEVYGQEWIQIVNDFIRNQKKTELIFSATPMVGNAVNSLVYPMFAQVDGTNVKPMDVNIRRLYWGGTKQLLSGFYGMVNALNGAQPTTLAIYPFAGSVDDPYTPTLSLDWGIPKLLYYQYPGQIWTTNNLYVRNYKRFIEQITDENSKIVVMWMKLSPSDISNFSFRYPVWIADSYYLVNKIIDYNPYEVGSVKVELLRLTHIDVPVAENILIWDDGLGQTSLIDYGMVVGGGLDNPNGNFSVSDGISTGYQNNNVGSMSGIIGGYGNVIGNVIVDT